MGIGLKIIFSNTESSTFKVLVEGPKRKLIVGKKGGKRRIKVRLKVQSLGMDICLLYNIKSVLPPCALLFSKLGSLFVERP